jgi:hypothetical protein
MKESRKRLKMSVGRFFEEEAALSGRSVPFPSLPFLYS